MTARAHYGRSKSGKSHAYKRLVEVRARAGGKTIVFDRIYEWVGRDGYTELQVPVAHASTEDGLAKWVTETPTNVLVFQPPDIFESTAEDPLKPSASMTRAACVLARECLRHGMVFVSAEAHRIAPNGPKLPWLLDELVGAGRHYQGGAEWWADTQAFSLLSTRVRRQATEVRIFSMVEPQELSALQDAYGPEMVAAVRECSARCRVEERGWFVDVDPDDAEPPWRLGRFTTDGGIIYEMAGQPHDEPTAETTAHESEMENASESVGGSAGDEHQPLDTPTVD